MNTFFSVLFFIGVGCILLDLIVGITMFLLMQMNVIPFSGPPTYLFGGLLVALWLCVIGGIGFILSKGVF